LESVLFEQFFDSEERHWWFVGRRHLVLSLLERAGAEGTLLDVGCGTGGLLQHLEPFGESFGVDPAWDAARCGRRRRARMVMATGLGLPVADARIDAVLALDVLEHVADDVGMAREAARVLRPGGHLLVTVPALPALWSGHDVVNWHHRRYTRRTLRAVLDAAGLQILVIKYFNSLLLPLAVARKLLLGSHGAAAHHYEDLPGPINALLGLVFSAETWLLRFVSPPLGASLVALARRS
jgi:SAM-dependent methyltransferase